MDIIQKKIVRSVFTVKEKIFVTPHYIRVIFDMSDEQLVLFSEVTIGRNNKIFIPPFGAGTVDFPDETGASSSIRRTYTTRHIDFGKNEMWIDFVAHGDNGPASSWAQRAEAGHILGIAMKVSDKPLLPEADSYLLIGDSTAIPVISAMLEQLPEGVDVKAILEVHGPEDEIGLSTRADLRVEWLHNPDPSRESELASFVSTRSLPQGKRFAYIAAEYDTAKALRQYFKEEQNWSATEFSAVSYWKRGEAEEESAATRREK
ncbi:siderophore-interacting protein [Chitinophaga arvensicola]|uniref:NADPH-dependent ferric siderophore reductase, contains FAD-binding and SIP domains n=1 Tax=Chitinophaga arvensicola TaxID=29529 RepID=A0A1I0S9L7_9BACT|nr:siderophore-interacting protein [Chitinophaga arvensicola]SEW52873.1 NADPH-dependent ferric siderophore reductase, contains FAD-binding and SIP domains [Chitinophaga arvensicola]